MSRQPTPLQSLYRLTVMAGTLVVGSMAAYRYGPPPEQLASTIDAAVARVDELRAQVGAPPAATEPTGAAQPLASLAPAQPAPAWAPTSTPTTAVPPLPSADAPGVVVEPLGANGLAYRATGSAAGPGGLIRRFDAVAETPEQAKLALLDKMSAAQRGG